MAMRKADYEEQGRDDARAGNQSRRPAIPGTWQYKAYMGAWEAAQPVQMPVKRAPVAPPKSTRLEKRYARIAQAMVARIQWRRNLRSLRAA